MKPFPHEKWRSMNSAKRSWLICRAFDLAKPSIYWILVHPTEGQIGGSYQSMKFCQGLVSSGRSLSRKKSIEACGKYPHPVSACAISPSVAFPRYAEYDHLAVGLIKALNRDGFEVEIRTRGDLWIVGIYLAYPSFETEPVAVEMKEGLAEALCEAAMDAKGLFL
jgi:hypothetical protein